MRLLRILGLLAAIVLLPLLYVRDGALVDPFVMDLAAHPDRYRLGETMLVLNEVSETGPGFVVLGEPGGSLRLRADSSFHLEKGEVVDVKVRFRDNQANPADPHFEVAEVNRHPTRNMKWLVSVPALLVVMILLLGKIRFDREGIGFAIRGDRDA